jgi:hypothetical protein
MLLNSCKNLKFLYWEILLCFFNFDFLLTRGCLEGVEIFFSKVVSVFESCLIC